MVVTNKPQSLHLEISSFFLSQDLNYSAAYCNRRGGMAKLYIPSTLNNSNETHTFMCLGRTGRFGQH